MREEIPFTNEFDQVINPGDEVVVVTTCTKYTVTTKGIYVGMFGKRVQAKVPCVLGVWFNTETGEKDSYFNIPSGKREYRKMRGERITTLWQNKIYKLA